MSMKKGVQAIIQKINADASLHGDEYLTRLKTETDIDAASENEAYSGEIAKRREMLINNNIHEYDRLYDRVTARLNREILDYRHRLIDEIFDMAVSKLKAASENEFSDMFLAAVNNLQGSFILYLGETSLGKLDATAIEKAKKVNSRLDIVLSSETIPLKSGFVLMDERVEYNCLFEDLVEDMKNDQGASIIKEVFAEL